VAAGLALGEVPSVIVLAGVALAVPAAALISTQHDDSEGPASGAGYGVAAGIGFGVLFVALDQAGTASGAWPLLPGQIVALLVVIPLALHWSSRPLGWRLAVLPGAAAGTLGGIANLLFLAATGAGQLAVVAVLTALYPGVTLLLAGAVLGERWERVQVVGLLVAAAAIILITTG
ncbi:MAG: EamA family transporter, partial [Nocardioidaceae bacterium]